MNLNPTNRNWESIHKLITQAKSVVLSTHVNPDGDGLGSQVAAFHYLSSHGKECRILNPSALPDEYSFLNKNTKFGIYDRMIHSGWIMDVDLAIIFDIGEYNRLGKLGEDLKLAGTPTISIDHHPHPSPNGFTVYIHDTNVSAAGSLLYEYFDYADKVSENKSVITKDMAEGLYTAIMTDTGSFRFNNTTSETHKMAGDLLQYGVKPFEIYQNVYESNSIEKIKLLALAMENVQLDCDGKLAWFTISQDMMKETNATPSDISGFTDFVRSIRGVEVALMINEIKPEKCRINFRSKGRIRIGDLARKLNGGGHDFAAGAVVKLSLDYAVEYVVSETITVIKSQIAAVE